MGCLWQIVLLSRFIGNTEFRALKEVQYKVCREDIAQACIVFKRYAWFPRLGADCYLDV